MVSVDSSRNLKRDLKIDIFERSLNQLPKNPVFSCSVKCHCVTPTNSKQLKGIELCTSELSVEIGQAKFLVKSASLFYNYLFLGLK